MAAAEPWKEVLRQRARVAEDCCANAHGRLVGVAALLASPAHVAGAQGWRQQRPRVESDLAFAAAEMAACEIFALSAGAVDPTNPLPSIDYLPDAHHSVRLALGMLQSAKICAHDACDSLERCCCRVQMAYYLLDHPGLPGLYGLVEEERDAARGFLEAARGLAASGAELAAAAVPARW
ncbi:hypothetical protein EJB05_31404, partial [Eragrostis curvula]